VGQVRHVLGRLDRRGGRWQIAHPTAPSAEEVSEGRVARYPVIAGVPPATLRKLVGRVLDTLPEPPEWLPGELLRRQAWPGWRDAVAALHRSGLEHEREQARRRLAFDELLAFQLRLRR